MKKYGKDSYIEVSEIEAEFENKQQILKDIGNYGVRIIKVLSPRKTRKYLNGFTYEITNNEEVHIYNSGVRQTLAHILEFGTRKMAARPHFRPAFKKISKYAEKKTQEFKIKYKLK